MGKVSDIESLLADILDDSKPLPTPADTVIATVSNAGPAALSKAAETLSDADYLERLMNGEAEPEASPSPLDIAAAVEVQGEMALADATPSVFTDTEDRTNPVDKVKMPVFTADDFASTMDIRNFATLVTLNTARWHAKVKDRKASKDAATANDADQAAFETRKRLLVGADAQLRAVHKIIDEARAAHYDMTLPWTTTSMNDDGRRTGGRLLPNTLFVEYTTAMAKYLQQMNAALDVFVAGYADAVNTAKTKLGKRFDPTEYPNSSSIRGHFMLSFDFQPIPKGEDFAGLPQAQLNALASKINDNTRVQAENAMQELWMRMRTVVARMAERLLTPDNVFQNTLVQNVRDTARLMAHLNVTGDPRVDALRTKVEKLLCQHDAKDLREKPVLRAQVGAHAASIIQEMDK